jgi:hypothetical protein
MRIHTLLTFLLLTLLSITSLSAEKLTKSSIKNMISNMDKAASKRDVVSISRYMHPNAVIKMHVTISGKEQEMQINKQQYIQLLTQGLQAATTYEHETSNVKIRISNKKAFVSMEITETVGINGRTQVGESQENMTIELINGHLMVTEISAYTTL